MQKVLHGSSSKLRQLMHNSVIAVIDAAMPKRLIRKLMPTPEQIASMKVLKLFGKRASAPQLWQVNRRSVTKAVFVGSFFGVLPIPFHSMLILLAAIFLRVNLPISLALAWLVNPLTIFPILYIGFWIGTQLFHIPMADQETLMILMHQLIDWIMTFGASQLDLTLLKPLIIGLMIEALIVASVLFMLTHLFWHWSVFKRRKKRDNQG